MVEVKINSGTEVKYEQKGLLLKTPRGLPSWTFLELIRLTYSSKLTGSMMVNS